MKLKDLDLSLIRLREVDARAWAWIEDRPFSLIPKRR